MHRNHNHMNSFRNTRADHGIGGQYGSHERPGVDRDGAGGIGGGRLDRNEAADKQRHKSTVPMRTSNRNSNNPAQKDQ